MRALQIGLASVFAALTLVACAPPIETEEMDIFQASYSAELSRVEYLLSLGADPNFKSEEGFPCLVAALSRDRFEIAELLYDNGADIEATVPSGATIYVLFDQLLSQSVDYSAMAEEQSASPQIEEGSEEYDEAMRELEADLEDYEYVEPTVEEYYSLEHLESETWTPDSVTIQAVIDWLEEHGARRPPE